jgi:hypothetical protein
MLKQSNKQNILNETQERTDIDQDIETYLRINPQFLKSSLQHIKSPNRKKKYI